MLIPLLVLTKVLPCSDPAPRPSPPWCDSRPPPPASSPPPVCTSGGSRRSALSSGGRDICPRPVREYQLLMRSRVLMTEKKKLTFLYSLWTNSSSLYSSANSAQSLIQTCDTQIIKIIRIIRVIITSNLSCIFLSRMQCCRRYRLLLKQLYNICS